MSEYLHHYLLSNLNLILLLSIVVYFW